MAKTKRKEGSEIEYLRGQIRELETENRQLRRRVRKLDKRSHLYEEIIDVIPEDISINDDKCPTCKKGKLKLLDLKYVKYLTCDNDDCEYKEKI